MEKTVTRSVSFEAALLAFSSGNTSTTRKQVSPRVIVCPGKTHSLARRACISGTSSLTLRAMFCPKNVSAARHRPPKRARRGAAALDYVLVMAVVLPLAGFLMWAGPRMMNLVYETTAVLISWPFL